MDRSEKKQFVETLNGAFNKCALVVVVKHSGLTVAEMTDLRVKMRNASASFKVTKNSLTRIALRDTQHQGLTDLFEGPTAIAYSEDPIAAAKVVVDFARTNEKMSVIGACLSGQVFNEAGVKALATLPSLDELRSKIIGLLMAPATKVASVLQAPASQLARVFKAYADKGNS